MNPWLKHQKMGLHNIRKRAFLSTPTLKEGATGSTSSGEVLADVTRHRLGEVRSFSVNLHRKWDKSKCLPLSYPARFVCSVRILGLVQGFGSISRIR